MAAAGMNVFGNTLTNNSFGIRASGGLLGSQIRGNTISQVRTFGIYLVSATGLTVGSTTVGYGNTVTGGTGWSVELARMWSKRLWVFDQDKGIWFRWNGEDWVEGTPKLDATTICGTGTRYLSDSGRQAIEDLFARSFAE